MSESRKSGYVPTTFSDAGTGETFEGGKSHLFEPGAHGNYKAAGLIGTAPATAKAAPKPKAKPKTARKSAAPVTATPAETPAEAADGAGA